MTTGADLWLHTQGLIDKDYSGWNSPAKANRIFKHALYNVIEQKIASADSQKISDELGILYTTKEITGLRSNKIYKLALQVVALSYTSGTGNLIVTTAQPHNFAVGTSVTISGNDGSGTFSVTSFTSDTFTVNIGVGLPGSFIAQGYVYSSAQLTNYFRLIAIRATMHDSKMSASITGATATFPVVITIDKKTSLRTGSRIYITGISAPFTSNAYFYLRQLSDKKFELYTDEALDVPVNGIGGGSFSSSNQTIRQVFSRYCTPYFGDQKISSLATPGIFEPKYEDTDHALLIHPTNITCASVQVDYVKKPSQLIDVENSTIDLELIYNFKFLEAVATEFANIFAFMVKDESLSRSTDMEVIQNP